MPTARRRSSPLPDEVLERDYPQLALVGRMATAEHFGEMFDAASPRCCASSNSSE